jgi:hypothetical protein
MQRRARLPGRRRRGAFTSAPGCCGGDGVAMVRRCVQSSKQSNAFAVGVGAGAGAAVQQKNSARLIVSPQAAATGLTGCPTLLILLDRVLISPGSATVGPITRFPGPQLKRLGNLRVVARSISSQNHPRPQSDPLQRPRPRHCSRQPPQHPKPKNSRLAPHLPVVCVSFSTVAARISIAAPVCRPSSASTTPLFSPSPARRHHQSSSTIVLCLDTRSHPLASRESVFNPAPRSFACNTHTSNPPRSLQLTLCPLTVPLDPHLCAKWKMETASMAGRPRP